MRNLFISAALLLAACGPSEDSFSEDFLAAACDAGCELDSEFYCNPPEATGTTDATTETECEFDKKAAKDCLNGEFTCDETGLTVAPAECANVYSC